MYGPYLYLGEHPESIMWINVVLISPELKKIQDSIFVEYTTSNNFNSTEIQQNVSKIISEEAGRSYIHIKCENLREKTRYEYRIRTLNKIILSGKSFHFTTGTKNACKFIIYGDDQTADFVPILAQITNHYQYQVHPDFIVHLGDINQNLWHDQENNAFFTTKQKLFRNIPYMPVLGNHDAKPISRYDAIYTLPHWYTIDYGKAVRIICLSGYDGFIPQTNGQYEFLEQQIQTGGQQNRFIIITVHETFFSIEDNIPEEKAILELREYIFPLLQKYNRGLQRNILVFSGHVHEYCRIIRNDLTFFTVGACSNAKWYSKLTNSATHAYHPEIAVKEFGKQSFAVISIRDDILTVEIQGWGHKIIEKLDFKI